MSNWWVLWGYAAIVGFAVGSSGAYIILGRRFDRRLDREVAEAVANWELQRRPEIEEQINGAILAGRMRLLHDARRRLPAHPQSGPPARVRPLRVDRTQGRVLPPA